MSNFSDNSSNTNKLDVNSKHLTIIPFRVGHGYDIHRFAHGRDLILGGVKIPYFKGLEGHSDADCLIHAISDALLGAAALPDIGHYFPNTDPTIRGISSHLILEKVVQELTKLHYGISNVDISVIAQEPKIKAHIPAMKEKLSHSLKIPPDHIGIKATTNEHLGALGRAEGIAVHAVVLIYKIS